MLGFRVCLRARVWKYQGVWLLHGQTLEGSWFGVQGFGGRIGALGFRV